ncbi:MAG: hypothetical protein GX772_13020 [Alcaligenaceae bacterium]|nr:hypothetical protein [Alcaligenaceae bacterium]
MSGISQLSEGQALNAFSGGKAECGTDALEVVLGTNTEITFGFTNELVLGSSFSYHAGVQMDALLGGQISLHKGPSVASELETEDYYVNSYSMAVGASGTEGLALNRLRNVLFLLLSAQAVSLTATGILTAVQMSKATDKEKVTDLGVSSEVGYLLTVLNNIGALVAIITAAFMLGWKKVNTSARASSPGAALSLHQTGVLFLGNRKANEVPPVDPTNAGMLIDNTGLEISAAKIDREYRKDGAIIQGFETGASGEDGATFKLHNDGSTVLEGKSFAATLKAPSNGAAKYEVKANEHSLQVMDQAGTATTEALLTVKDKHIGLKSDARHSVTVETNNVSAAITGVNAEMKLTNQSSTLRFGNQQVEVKADKITVGKLTIDNTGLKFGDLTVFDPAAPQPLPAVQPSPEDKKIEKSNKESEQARKKKEAEDQSQKAVASAQIAASQQPPQVASSVNP